MKPITQMTQEEEDELAKFLNFGMTVSEAREMKENEKRLADIKLQIREQWRATERRAICGRVAWVAQTKYSQGAPQRGLIPLPKGVSWFPNRGDGVIFIGFLEILH